MTKNKINCDTCNLLASIVTEWVGLILVYFITPTLFIIWLFEDGYIFAHIYSFVIGEAFIVASNKLKGAFFRELLKKKRYFT